MGECSIFNAKKSNTLNDLGVMTFITLSHDFVTTFSALEIYSAFYTKDSAGNHHFSIRSFIMSTSPSLVNLVDESHKKEFVVYISPYDSTRPYLRSLVVGDSRLWNSSGYGWEDLSIDEVSVISWRGGRVNDLASRALERASSGYWFSIKLCFGVNDILDGRPPHDIFNSLKALKDKILTVCPDTLIAFSEIYPVDLDKARQTGRTQTIEQGHAMKNISSLNELIHSENRRIASYFDFFPATPCFTNFTMKCVTRGKKKLRVVRKACLYDGIHGTSAVKCKVVKAVMTAIELDAANFRASCYWSA